MSALDPDVTEAMVEAGQRMASDLTRGAGAKLHALVTNVFVLEDFLKGVKVDRDLVTAHIEGRMDSVTAIYLAMDRARRAQ